MSMILYCLNFICKQCLFMNYFVYFVYFVQCYFGGKMRQFLLFYYSVLVRMFWWWKRVIKCQRFFILGLEGGVLIFINEDNSDNYFSEKKKYNLVFSECLFFEKLFVKNFS